MELLNKLHLNWWQALILVVVIYLGPLIKAFAVVVVGRCVKPEIAKIALPLMFSPSLIKRKNKQESRD